MALVCLVLYYLRGRDNMNSIAIKFGVNAPTINTHIIYGLLLFESALNYHPETKIAQPDYEEMEFLSKLSGDML